MRYQLRTFGGWKLLGPEGEPIDALQPHSKGAALLSVLATRPPREPVDRDELVALLWPEVPEERARGTLRVTLTRLREHLPEDALGGKGEQRIWLDASVVDSDVRAFERALEEGRTREALEHYRGPFLEHVHLSDAPAFNRWAEERRLEYRREAYGAALELGERARQQEDAEGAEEAYRRALDLEPLQEKAAAGLMRALAEQGRRADALKLYRSFRDRVEEELELAPSDRLEELAERIRSEPGHAGRESQGEAGMSAPEIDSREEPESPLRTWSTPRRMLALALGLIAVAGAALWWGTTGGESEAGTATGPSDLADRPTLAVLPFDAISSDSGDAFFARGMHEEVLTQLSKVSGLTVKSRTSVLQYRGTDRTVGEISRELGGVTAILEGSVRRAGDQVVITAQLIDAREDAQLWARTYERELGTEQIFDAQAEIAARIAEALAVEITPEERRRIETPPTGDLAAYDAYLKGRSQLKKFYEEDAGPTHLDSAVGLFRRAVRRDSAFAPAHAFLGMAYAGVYAASPENRWRDSAFSAARRAIRIDPDRAEAHLALGFVHWRVGSAFEKGHFRRALARLERAWEFQPSSALAAGLLMVAHDWLGHDIETVRWGYRASLLAPNNPNWSAHVALVLFRVGLLEPAEAWGRKALAEGPDHSRAVRYLSVIREEQEGPKAALRTLGRFREKHPDHPRALEFAAGFHLRAGRYDSARALYLRAREVRRAEQARASAPGPAEIELPPMEQARFGYTLIQLGDTARGRNLIQEGLASRRQRERPPTKWGLVNNAELNAVLGNREEAYRLLERALERGYYGELESPLFEGLRGEGRFARLRSRALKEQRAMQERIRNLDIQLVPDGSVSAPSG